jgi:TolB protein
MTPNSTIRCLLIVFVLLASGSPVSLFASQSTQKLVYLAYTQGYWQVWSMNTEGAQQRQVTRSAYDKSRVSWFSDGEHLLVNGTQGQLNRVDIASGEEKPITLKLTGMVDAVLAPDGMKFAFSLSIADSVDRNDIWVCDLDGSHLAKVTRMQGLQHEPSWGPEGQVLYFLSGAAGESKQNHDIFKLSLADGSREQLTVNALFHFDIAVSTAGDLAYSSNRGGDYDIWLQPRAESARQLTQRPGIDAKPSFANDGKTIFYEATANGLPNIWRLSVADRQTRQLTYHDTGARSPVAFPGHGGPP